MNRTNYAQRTAAFTLRQLELLDWDKRPWATILNHCWLPHIGP